MTAARKRRALTAGGPLTATLLGALLLIAGMLGSGGGVHAASPATETVVFTPSQDTYIQEDDAGASHNTTTLSIVGDANVGTDTWTGIAFDVSSIPSDATVTSATLTLTVDTAPAGTMNLDIDRIISGSSWTEAATWTGTQTIWSTVASSSSASFSGSSPVVFTVTGDVGLWVGGSTNKGWVLSSSGSDTVIFDSSEGSTPPSLSVTYSTSATTLSPSGTYSADVSGGFEDTWVQLLVPSTNRGGTDHLEVALKSTDRQDALVRFNLTGESPALGAARIVSATLTLPVTSGVGSGRTFQAGRICTPAGLSLGGAVSTATYNSLPYVDLATQDAVNYVYTPGDGDLTFDVTAIVQKWVDGEPNLGFRIRQTGSFVIDSIEIGSFNSSLDADRPSLTIEYVADTGSPNPTPTPSCLTSGDATATSAAATSTAQAPGDATNTAIAANATGTAAANNTATSVAATSTASSDSIATSVAGTTTAIANATSTAVAGATSTAVASATNAADSTATSVAGTSTAVASATNAADATATSIAATSTAAPIATSTAAAAATSTAAALGTATPSPSSELQLTGPSVTVVVSRSRLQFDATAGSLAPDTVTFVIKRTSDDMFWNGGSGAWEAGEVANPGVDSSGTWSFAVEGADRREFVDIAITVEVRATESSVSYVSTPLSVIVR